jgi:hypothetical protein
MRRRTPRGPLHQYMTCLLLGILSIIAVSYTQAAVVTLQEGVHQYTGCQDSYVFYYGHQPLNSGNFGSNTNLLLDSQHFTPY